MTSRITLLLPFFNEQGWIGNTLASLAQQTDSRFCLLLLDNGSTDGGRSEAERALAAAPSLVAEIIDVPTPGKANALATGLHRAKTDFVAICDADTHYPPDYIARCLKLFETHPKAAAVMAIDLYTPLGLEVTARRIEHVLRKAHRHPELCHAGGYAQAFRTDALRQAGGFDITRWPFVLEDHEIVHRVHRFGPSVYDAAHCCFPSARRTNRRAVSWTAFERFIYRHTPPVKMDWFFYSFLWRRLEQRRAFAVALRVKTWP